ncbi:MAG TPA: hypothetical protein VHE12_00775 [bacterium]|nr:hypothetical protein [bacterium]
MKPNFKVLLPILAFGGLLAFWGCQTQIAPLTAYTAPNSAPNYTRVCNFETAVVGASSDSTNSSLFEVGVPGNTVQTAGSWAIINNFPANENANMFIAAGGAAGTPQAAHISGAVTDLGDGTYPSIGFEGYLDTASGAPHNAYNMSFFTGVKFYVNFMPSDTTPSRFFYIPTTQEAKPPQGDCTAATGCYNYFGYTFPAGSSNGWKQYSFQFDKDLVTSYGVKPVPNSLTGVNLTQVLGLLWQVGRQNVAGVSNVDFYVDEVYFY